MDLYWLPKDAAWTDKLASLDAEKGSAAWDTLCKLANAPLDNIDALRLDRRLNRLFEKAAPPGLATNPVRLAVLASSTVDHLLPSIRVAGLRRGIWITTYTPDYGQYTQELMDSSSALHGFAPDAVLFALDAHHLLSTFEPGDSSADVDARLQRLSAELRSRWKQARAVFRCQVIQQTILPVFVPVVGNNEYRLASSRAWLVERLNSALRELATAEGVDLLALDVRVAIDGMAAWHDPALWYRAKQEVHPSAAPLYGDLMGRLLAAAQGRSYKCLVLDLDNTLWGGVIGDDGLAGIKLGQGSGLGEAYVGFQQYAQALSRRGVILAVCSKNDEANALEPFDKHPEMVLKRSDIACFIANWTDKASNLREIARRLNIGLDALVFVDDNAFERTIVRRELPMVAVPELPEDPTLYPACIADAGYFETLSVTEDDLKRAEQYQANVKRESMMVSASTDLEGYLRSLNMEIRWSRFDKIGHARIVQLINKTNQFNLTTRRATDESISALIDDENALTLQIRLVDQFGDNGIIAIVIGLFETGTRDIRIDTWLMSCRVLGRQVEEGTLNLVAQEAQRLGAVRLIGEYRPTAKNDMVRAHYEKLDFAPLGQDEQGSTRWLLDLASFVPRPTFIRSVAAGQEIAAGAISVPGPVTA